MLGGRAYYSAANWPRVGITIIVTNPPCHLLGSWILGYLARDTLSSPVMRSSLNGRHLGLGH
jgi:hypothetical protein